MGIISKECSTIVIAACRVCSCSLLMDLVNVLSVFHNSIDTHRLCGLVQLDLHKDAICSVTDVASQELAVSLATSCIAFGPVFSF